MTLVVVKLASSSSEESLALCAIATVDQAVDRVEDLAAKEENNSALGLCSIKSTVMSAACKQQK